MVRWGVERWYGGGGCRMFLKKKVFEEGSKRNQ